MCQSGNSSFPIIASIGLGRLKSTTETISYPGEPNRTHTLQNTYDMRSNLTRNWANINGSLKDTRYSYNKDGNIYRKRIIGTPDTYYEYDTTPGGSVFDSDIMTKAGSDSLTWNLNGRLTAKPSIFFEYNWDGKLRTSTAGTGSISLKYDPAGNRVYKASSVAGNRKYIVDIIGGLPTILLEIDPNSGMEIKKTYIYGNSQILAQHNGSYNAPRYFYLHDRLGSVRLLIDTAGVVKNSYTYNAFGESFPTECTEAVSNPFKFTGQWFDSEIEQYYLRARMYDPQLMRFTSRDPVVGNREEPLTLHRYLYCLNSPVDYVDPTGKSLVDVLCSMGIWAEENADALVIGGLAMTYTYALVNSSAYQQMSLAFAASASDAVQDVGLAMSHNYDKLRKMLHNHDQQHWDNSMGNINLPPGTGKIIAITSIIMYAAYEFGDDVLNYIKDYEEFFEKWLYGDDTPSVTTPPSP